MINIEDYNFLKSKYNGIIEIYPTKCMNIMVLDKVLIELEKDYDLVKITKDWIRAFVKDKEINQMILKSITDRLDI